MTTDEIRKKLRAGIYWDGAVIFGLKPAEWGSKEVHESFPDRFKENEDETSENRTVKTYEEYLLILAKTEKEILARLVMQDKDTNIRIVLKAKELAGIAQLIGIENIYNLEDALKLRDEMMPQEEGELQ